MNNNDALEFIKENIHRYDKALRRLAGDDQEEAKAQEAEKEQDADKNSSNVKE